jgi:hypothetical protein
MIEIDGSEGAGSLYRVRCNGCDRPGPSADGVGMARLRAINLGWSTARGRHLCPGCTAAHNASLPPSTKEQARK